MSTERRARLFRNGRNQAVRIPRELELPGDEVVMHREGDRLVLEPAPARRLASLLASWASSRRRVAELPEIVDLAAEPEDFI